MVGLPYESMRSAFDTMHSLENLYRVYSDPLQKGRRNQIEYRMASYPIIGDYLRNRDAEKYITDYMSNRSLTWDDVKYPALLKGSNVGYGTYRTSINAVERLYR